VRIYRIPLVSTAVTVAIDHEINPAAGQLVKLTEMRWGQATELGDAAEEQLTVSLVTGHTTSGSGGNAAVTAPPDYEGDPTWTGNCETFNTTAASSGTTTTRILGTWAVRTEFLWIPVPKRDTPPGIWLPYNVRSVIRISAPADSITWTGGYIEIGVVGAA
jgi:hypothetical protein